MISVSVGAKEALESDVRNFKVKVEITRNNSVSTPIDISDRISNVSISHDYERKASNSSIEIDNYDFLLSPLNRNSSMNQIGGVYDPLLDAKHTIKIWEGIKLSDGSYEYIQKFTGVLGDEIDADSMPGTISLSARDNSKHLQDTYIYQSKTYKLTVVETVIQDMINMFLPNMFNIEVLNPTNYMIGRPDKPYTAKDINLWDAVQSLADASSHELRFMEDGRLVMRKIVRDFNGIEPSLTLDETKISKDSVSISDADIRNHIMLRVQGLDPIEKKDQHSIDKYGRRYMEVHRGLSNIITTAEQAHQLLNDMLSDLSFAKPIDRVELPLDPRIQVGDIATIENTRTGVSPTYEKFKITRVQDVFSSSRKRTSLHMEGYSIFSPEDSIAPEQVTGLNNELITRVIQNYAGSGWSGSEKTTYYPLVKWTPVTKDISGNILSRDFGGYTLYRNAGETTSSGTALWYPIASIKSYIEPLNLDTSYFYDYTAKSGQDNSYKMIAINRLGKSSTESLVMTVSVPATVYS
jgi:hypothetical protein